MPLAPLVVSGSMDCGWPPRLRSQPGRDEAPYVPRGAYGTIYYTSLPPWCAASVAELPEAAAEEVVEEVGLLPWAELGAVGSEGRRIGESG